MINYPLNLIEKLPVGEHKIRAYYSEFEALKAVCMATLPPDRRSFDYGFKVGMDKKYQLAPDSLGYMTVVIVKNDFKSWRKMPSSLVITPELVRLCCDRAQKSGEKFHFKVDSTKEMRRLRAYASRFNAAARAVKVEKVTDTDYVVRLDSGSYSGYEGINLDVCSVRAGFKRDLHAFFTIGSSAYVRSQVSTLNSERGLSYSVQKISGDLFYVSMFRQEMPHEADLIARYRLLMASGKTEAEAHFDELISEIKSYYEDQ